MAFNLAAHLYTNQVANLFASYFWFGTMYQLCMKSMTTKHVDDQLSFAVLQDKTWDISKFIFVRQLGFHTGPVTMVTINQLNVNTFLWFFLTVCVCVYVHKNVPTNGRKM